MHRSPILLMRSDSVKTGTTDSAVTAVNNMEQRILRDGGHYNATSFDAKSSAYIETRVLAREEVCRAFGIDPSVVGMTTNANYASADAYHQALYQDALSPLMVWLQDEFSEQLLYVDFEDVDSGYFLEFNINAKLQGSFVDQMNLAQKLVGVTMTDDEFRQKFQNLPPLTDEQRAKMTPRSGPLANPGPQNPVPQNQFDTPVADMPMQIPAKTLEIETKAVGEITRESYAKKHADVYTGLFTRMKQSMNGDKTIPNKKVWVKQLYDDLRPLAAATTLSAGAVAAARFGGSFSEKYVQHWLDANTKAISELTIEKAAEDLAISEDTGAFWDSKIVQAEMLGASRATQLANFAMVEAGKQSSGKQHKIWVVTNPRSRHPEMNGEQVPLFSAFSNGMQYPGDSAGGVDQVANCKCLIEIA